MTMWGGRFSDAPNALFKAFNDSLRFDCMLVREDIRGSIAWAEALARANILTTDECVTITDALRDLNASITDVNAVGLDDAEDIHSWVESALIDRIGALGKKLHTGRSRNDQVATDLRLWLRSQIDERVREIRAVQHALVTLARRHETSVIPGYTHLQRAQPILFAHWCLAYFEMLDRDATRFTDARRRMNRCPLGSGALAGSGFNIDRVALARSLAFDAPTENSLDAVSDRDFVLETLSASSMCGIHLSRMAEDLIFYATAEAGFIEISDEFSSGSSLMPQKKNPDALELIRGKCGRLIGAQVGLSTTLKGLPLAYNKDMQEDKEGLFDAMHTLSMCLSVSTHVLDGLTLNENAAREAALGGYANATDLADHLVEQGVPFRDAHEQVGTLVRTAIEKNARLEELPHDTIVEVAPNATRDVHVALTIDASLSRRSARGGTAPDRVLDALRTAGAHLDLHSQHPVVHGIATAPTVQVRPAHIHDVDSITALVAYWAGQGENLPRPREEILHEIAEFGVATAQGSGTDGERIVGCGSLYVYTPMLAEIRSLGVSPSFHGGGAGSKLARFLIRRARDLHIPRVFVLTRAPEFFEHLGFERGDMSTLPEKVWKDCAKCSRRDNCDEIAMIYTISPNGSA